jgi:hypothetical protein
MTMVLNCEVRAVAGRVEAGLTAPGYNNLFHLTAAKRRRV